MVPGGCGTKKGAPPDDLSKERSPGGAVLKWLRASEQAKRAMAHTMTAQATGKCGELMEATLPEATLFLLLPRTIQHKHLTKSCQSNACVHTQGTTAKKATQLHIACARTQAPLRKNATRPQLSAAAPPLSTTCLHVLRSRPAKLLATVYAFWDLMTLFTLMV